MDDDAAVSVLFGLLCDLMLQKGFASIKDLPACAELAIDAHWWVAVNAHRDACKCSKGAVVPPFTAYFEFNGWPAGFVEPCGGFLAAGRLANEDTLAAAIKNAMQPATGVN